MIAGEFHDRKRIKRLHSEIVKKIPKFPNDKKTKQILESKSLGLLLIDYIQWQMRLVPRRPRIIQIDDDAKNDRRWNENFLKPFLEKATLGADLTPHLSLKALKEGFSPASGAVGGAERWVDKDQVLNAFGYHHFHPSTEMEAQGHAKRSDLVVFARVYKTKFRVIGLFNHTVFDDPRVEFTPERARLWQLFKAETTAGMKPGTVYVSNLITTSCHSMHAVNLAQLYVRKIRELEPKLDDPNYEKWLFEQGGLPFPKKRKWSWSLHDNSLGIFEEKSGTVLWFYDGPF